MNRDLPPTENGNNTTSALHYPRIRLKRNSTESSPSDDLHRWLADHRKSLQICMTFVCCSHLFKGCCWLSNLQTGEIWLWPPCSLRVGRCLILRIKTMSAVLSDSQRLCIDPVLTSTEGVKLTDRSVSHQMRLLTGFLPDQDELHTSRRRNSSLHPALSTCFTTIRRWIVCGKSMLLLAKIYASQD
jgi:hypothetical protein